MSKIRFINSAYKTLFYINDGDYIEETYADGSKGTTQCHYVDEYHVYLNGRTFHICEFAELKEKHHTSYAPTKQAKINFAKHFFAPIEEAMLKTTKSYKSDYYDVDLKKLYDDLTQTYSSNKANDYVFIARECGTQLIPFADCITVRGEKGDYYTSVSEIFEYYLDDIKRGKAVYYTVHTTEYHCYIKEIKNIEQFINHMREDAITEYSLKETMKNIADYEPDVSETFRLKVQEKELIRLNNLLKKSGKHRKNIMTKKYINLIIKLTMSARNTITDILLTRYMDLLALVGKTAFG